jgi:hypothetical protein
MGSHGRRGDAFGVNKSNTARRCSSAEGAAWCLLEGVLLWVDPDSPESGVRALLSVGISADSHRAPHTRPT